MKKVLFILIPLIGIGAYLLMKEPPLGADKNPVVSINGKQVEMKFSDNNDNEDLIIRTGQEDFFGLGGAVVYFTVTNNSGQNQNVSLVTGATGKIETTYLKVKSGEHTQTIPSTLFTHSTTTGETVGEDEKTITITDWSIIKQRGQGRINDRNEFGVSKKSVQGVLDKSNAVLIADGETKLFSLSQRYVGDPAGSKFYIEAFGDNGAYGHLDPNDWVATEPFEGTNDADLDGTSGGTGWSNAWSVVGGASFDFNTATKYEGSSSVDSQSDDDVMQRDLTTDVDTGIVKIAMNSDNVDDTGGTASAVARSDYRIGAGTAIWNLYFDPANSGAITISDIGGGETEVVLASPADDTWYEVHMDFDMTAGTVRARLSTDSEWTPTIGVSSGTDIGRVRLFSNGGQVAISRFDDMGTGEALAAGGAVNDYIINLIQ